MTRDLNRKVMVLYIAYKVIDTPRMKIVKALYGGLNSDLVKFIRLSEYLTRTQIKPTTSSFSEKTINNVSYMVSSLN